jgi:hypothetical protein
MTEQERLDRQGLLRRAAAAAGAVYVVPAMTSTASAAAECSGICAKLNKKGECKKKRRKFGGEEGCRALDNCPGQTCRCLPEGGTSKKCICKCAPTPPGCVPDRCPPATPCAEANFCNSSQTCICFVPVPGDGMSRLCVDFPSNFCADYPPCNKADGSGCPEGSCCLDTCCPEGICSPPCSSGAAPKISRTSGSGATLTL